MGKNLNYATIAVGVFAVAAVGAGAYSFLTVFYVLGLLA